MCVGEGWVIFPITSAWPKWITHHGTDQRPIQNWNLYSNPELEFDFPLQNDSTFEPLLDVVNEGRYIL